MVIQLEHNTIKVNGVANTDFKVFACGYFIFNNHFFHKDDIVEFVSNRWNTGDFKTLVPELSGCYQVIVLDAICNEVFIVQDRWGSYPLFYRQYEGNLSISSNYRLLIDDDVQYNESALVEYIGLGHVIGNKTLIEDIYEFKPHHTSRVCNDDDRWKIEEKSYWKYQMTFGKAGFKAKSKEFGQLWHKRLSILSEGIKSIDDKCYVPLSAGLDSRLIAGAMEQNGLKQFNLTFGSGNDNLEIETAAKVSKSLSNSLEHYILNVDHAGYRQLINEAPHTHRITTAYFGEKDLWYPSQKKEEISAILPGHSGDFMAGSHFKSKMKLWKSKEDLVTYIVNFKSTPLCKHLYNTDNFYCEKLHHSLINSLDDSDGLINAFIRWDLEERQRRYIIRSVISEDHEKLPLVVLPFFDYQLIDFFTDLPFSFLRNTELYRHSAAKYIFKYQKQLRKIPVNNRPIVPKTKGLVNEYYMKLKDYFNLKRNIQVFDSTIEWTEFIETGFLPPLMIERQWLKPDFFKTNSRFYYAISQFHKDLSKSTKQRMK